MKRVFVYLSALVGVGGMVYLAGQGIAQAPPAPAPKAGGKVAVFNVVKVLKDYQKFQSFVGTMTAKRQQIMAPLNTLRATVVKLQEDLQKETLPTKKDELQKSLVAKSREFEDAQRQMEASLDGDSSQYLRTAYGEIQKCVEAIAQRDGLTLVFAYPDAVTAEEMANPMYFTMKLRSQAAMPFYVHPDADITTILVATLNQHFPPPATQTGAAAPAAPQQK